MQCVLDDRDSLVVMPTGGGKSLCFQAPAMCREGLAVVVSPLLALMKDQVDGLPTCGMPAAAVNSTHSLGEKRDIAQPDRSRPVAAALYVAGAAGSTPDARLSAAAERLFFAIDEAHCIQRLGARFPARVSRPADASRALPEGRDSRLHGHGHRAGPPRHRRATRPSRRRSARRRFPPPNLQYHVARRERGLGQICQVIDRYRGQSGIVYCISRAEVDKTAAVLSEMGYSALPYHAGMSDEERIRNQDAFLTEQADIDRGHDRVRHGDRQIERSLCRPRGHAEVARELSAGKRPRGPRRRRSRVLAVLLGPRPHDVEAVARRDMPERSPQPAAMAALEKINAYATSRHLPACQPRSSTSARSGTTGRATRATFASASWKSLKMPLVIGQKILSCVLRVQERFGADYVSLVLTGSEEQRIVAAGHDELSTWGILKEFRRQDVRQWIEQLVSQGFLRKRANSTSLRVTDEGRRLLARRSDCPRCCNRRKKLGAAIASCSSSIRGTASIRDLFDSLRELRRDEANRARRAGVHRILATPRFATWPGSVRRRIAGLLDVHGVGQQKARRLRAAIFRSHRRLLSQAQRRDGRVADRCRAATAIARQQRPRQARCSRFRCLTKGLASSKLPNGLAARFRRRMAILESYIRHRRVTDATRWIPRSEFGEIDVGGSQLQAPGG